MHVLKKKNNNEALQVIHIAATPDEFEKDGITIRYFKIWNNGEFSNESALRKYRDFLKTIKQKNSYSHLSNLYFCTSFITIWYRT